MLVFISWSGRESLSVAQQLRLWLKDVMQSLEPWVSSQDIRQGARWSEEVAKRLQEASFGIICVTRENLAAPWLLFEAGALAKTLGEARVCPYLINLQPAELEGPLVQFQGATTSKADTLGLLRSLNHALGPAALPEEQVIRAFEKWWPDLERALQNIQADEQPLQEVRTDRSILEELVQRVRLITAPAATLRLPSNLPQLPPSLFEGTDIEDLRVGAVSLGTTTDPNAANWADGHRSAAKQSLDGAWRSRWNGGNAGDDWIHGDARVVQSHGFVYVVILDDGSADSFIALRLRHPDTLAGRYINLARPSEVLPWVGKIVNDARIDGTWPQGRWDLRR